MTALTISKGESLATNRLAMRTMGFVIGVAKGGEWAQQDSRTVSGPVPERELVRQPGRRHGRDRGLALGLQRPPSAQLPRRRWAHGRPYRTSAYRAAALRPWIAHYNHRRPHRPSA